MKLKKELKFFDVFSIASGAMISSGIFILPGIAYAKAGPAMVVSYFLGGIIALFGILSAIELATAMPKAGGDYFFITRTFGPMIGTISGLLSWIAISLKTALSIYGIAEVLGYFFFDDASRLTLYLLAVGTTLFFMILNIIGVDLASRFEILIVAVLIILITIYIVSGITTFEKENFIPFASLYKDKKLVSYSLFDGIKAIVSTTAFIFVSFGGLLKATTIAEEVKSPEKNIPKGILASIITITIFYTLLMFVTIGNSYGGDIANSLNPLAETAKKLLGDKGFYMMTFAAMLAFISTANAGIMAASRYPLALSRDNLVPAYFRCVNSRFKTPQCAIKMTGIIIIVFLLFSLENLAKVASGVILLAYVLTNASVIILRESHLGNYRPTFKTPFYPWIQIISVLVFSNFILKLGTFSLQVMLMLVLCGLLVYFKYGKKNSDSEYALLHLLMRITESINVSHNLEEELRDIIHERDEVTLDEFDNLIKEATILDLGGSIGLKELFYIEAARIDQKIGVEMEELVKLFEEREAERTTVVSNFTAIPHIILDSKKLFHLVVIRCKNGVRFSEEFPEVKAIFMFISNPELSSLHLKTLATVAQLTREENFEKRWIEAKNSDYIRDMILLSKRKRFKNKS